MGHCGNVVYSEKQSQPQPAGHVLCGLEINIAVVKSFFAKPNDEHEILYGQIRDPEQLLCDLWFGSGSITTENDVIPPSANALLSPLRGVTCTVLNSCLRRRDTYP
jgi:hypothetical protein